MLNLPFLNQKKTAAIDINLVPKDPFFETALGKILKWALSIGRYIVIFTELLVILSFVARFSLDRQLTDLNDSIQQKQSIIKSYGNLENEVLLIQAKIEEYQQIDQQKNITEIFPLLTKITPKNVRLENLSITPTRITMDGSVLSQDILNILINNFQLTPEFSKVVVGKIEASDDETEGLTFSISAQTGSEVELKETKSQSSLKK
jgi:Tfp pilus assembly protein PilN